MRDGEDLVTVVDVPAPLAALGTTVQVPTLDGRRPARDPGRHAAGRGRSRCAARGLPPLQRGRTGDLHVLVNVVIPRRLSREQRDLLERLAGTLDRRQPARGRGHALQAQARAGGMTAAPPAGSRPRALVRLGIRVRRERAEVALAELLPLLAARRGGDEPARDEVEYALYAPPAELPALDDVRALRRRRAGRRATLTRRPGRLGAALARVPPAGRGRRWRVARLRDAPAVAARRPRRRRARARDRPGQAFGAGAHPTTRLCLELLLGLEPGGALCDWGAGSGVLALAAARLGFGPVAAVELDAGRARGDRAERGRQRRRAVTARMRLDLAAAAPAPWAPTVAARNLTLRRCSTGDRRAPARRPPERLIASGRRCDREGADEVGGRRYARARACASRDARALRTASWAARRSSERP